MHVRNCRPAASAAAALVAVVLSAAPAVAAVAPTSSAPTAVEDAQVDPITAHYRQLGGAGSFLGRPVGARTAVARGLVQRYTGGAIFWSPATGAHEVHGALLGHYLALGGPAGPLGFPVTDETSTADRTGRYNHFSKGASIFWSPATGAHAVQGAVRDHWAALGWARGPLGYPVTDETSTADRVGRYSDFSRDASVYWSPATGAWSVRGAIRARWRQLGAVRSPLGYPLGDEYGVPGGRRSAFAGGTITWNASDGSTTVTPAAAPPGAGAPAVVSDLAAAPGDGGAALTFRAPAGGASPVTGYEVSVDGGAWRPLATQPGSASGTVTATVIGLSNGTAYRIAVRAVNAAGPGPASAAVTVTPVATVTAPAAVTGLVATPGDGSAALSFAEPATGGSPVTGYEVSVNDGAWTPVAVTADAHRRVATLTGLTNGTAYSVAVRAVNRVAAGPGSEPVTVTPVAPVQAPAAITDLQGVGGDGTADLVFTAPAGELTYEYSLDDGAWQPLEVLVPEGQPGTRRATLTGLTNDVPHTVVVRAVAGELPGAPSNAVTVLPKGAGSS